METADICVVACAEAFRPDRDIVVSPMGTVPRLGALLAMATFQPDLLLTDGEAYLLAEPAPLGTEADAAREGWLPFRDIFQVVNAGTRHVMMGASQIDRFGNQNISAIGDWKQPKVQLLGARGAPGNTANHTTSYWISDHNARVLCEQVDFTSGVGYDRAQGEAARFHDLRCVITNLAVLDFLGVGSTMRIRTVHPGVTVDDVQDATGFPLEVAEDVTTTREPTAEELALIARLDPRELRFREVPRAEPA